MEILDNEIELYISPEEHEWKAFIGPNSDYYLPIWTKFQKQDTKVHFHFPALFLTSHWMGYRKMYKYSIAYLLFSQSIPFLITYSIGSVGLQVQLIGLMFYPIFGLFSNWIYYQHAQKAIMAIKRIHKSETAQLKAIQEAGQTNASFPFILFFFSLFLVICVPLVISFFI